ncbi:MAG: chromate efflux transporter [Solirubrobacteraceae bacterium]
MARRPGAPGDAPPVPLTTILREWGRIGCLGFGGPPVHVAMLRELCVDRRRWVDDDAFEDAVAATNLLPGPASSQLAILSAWNVRGTAGAVIGGLAFVLPGLVAMIALAVVFLAASPPDAVRGAGAGAGAVVAAVALHAGAGLLGPSWRRARDARPLRWGAYVGLGAAAAIVVGPWLVLVLLACGALELAWGRRPPATRSGPRGRGGLGGGQRAGDGGGARRVGRGLGSVGRRDADAGGGRLSVHAWPIVLAAAVGAGGLGALAWTAFKVGALSYGGGFVIIPLMQADAVDLHGWMTDARFLDAVALGQVTPGPVVHTVAAVGYAAHGIGGALLAAFVAFVPSFVLVMVLASRFDAMRANPVLRGFLDGAGPAAIGAILGTAVPLALALQETWQFGLLAVGGVALLVLRASIVWTLVAAGAAGALAVVVLGAPIA